MPCMEGHSVSICIIMSLSDENQVTPFLSIVFFLHLLNAVTPLNVPGTFLDSRTKKMSSKQVLKFCMLVNRKICSFFLFPERFLFEDEVSSVHEVRKFK